MKNKLISASALFLTFVLLFGSITCFAQSYDASEIFEGILESKGAVNQGESIDTLIRGELAENAGIGSEWFVFALSQHGEYDFSSYESALLAYLQKNHVGAASSRLKYALCLAAIGSTSSYIQKTIDDSIGSQGLMSWVFGLHLMNNGYSCKKHTVSDIRSKLLSLQLSDGGWAISGQQGDVDATAMVIQALAPCRSDDPETVPAIERALSFISEKQLEDGDFSSYGAPNPESTSQVLIALCALGIDFSADTRFIKNGNTLFDGILKYKLDNKSFCHVEGGAENGTATAQALCAAVAYMRFCDGKTPLYTLDRADPANAEPAPEETENEQPHPQKAPSYKLAASIAIVAAGALACILLFILKKRNAKNFIAVILCAALLVALVCLTDIKSADDYYGEPSDSKTAPIGTVTLTIKCDAIVGRSELVPENGIILETSEFVIEKGDTVYSILVEAAKKHKIHLENDGTAAMPYISGIAYIYEYDFGELSGWVYKINGKRASVGAGEYVLSDGDVIEWYYTTNFGE